MNRPSNLGIRVLAFLAFVPLAPDLAQPATGESSGSQRGVQTKTFEVCFASDGRPASFKRLSDGKELLNLLRPGEGFFLRNAGGPPIPLSRLSLPTPDKLTAATDNGTQEVVFGVKRAEKYAAFRIERLKGVPASGSLTLHFAMNTDSAVRVMDLDYMTLAVNRSDGVTVSWNHLWNRNGVDPLGGFALYVAENEDDEDATLLRIWVDERLPHPKARGEWTLEAARQYVAEWQDRYADQSQFYIEAVCVADLYEA